MAALQTDDGRAGARLREASRLLRGFSQLGDPVRGDTVHAETMALIAFRPPAVCAAPRPS